jgi:hypothetical protein
MSFRTFLIIKALVCLCFGIILLIIPAELFGLLGGSLGDTGRFAAREYGAALVGILLLTWFAKDVKASDAKGAILLNLLVYDAIGMIITLLVVLSGTLNALGWSIVVVYLFFAGGAAFLLLKEKPFKQAHPQPGHAP